MKPVVSAKGPLQPSLLPTMPYSGDGIYSESKISLEMLFAQSSFIMIADTIADFIFKDPFTNLGPTTPDDR
jgi:hypothetical protein